MNSLLAVVVILSALLACNATKMNMDLNQNSNIDDATPTPPVINKQFRTNFTVSLATFNATTFFQGYLALDYINGGGLLNFGGEEIIPLYFHTNLVATPNVQTQMITGYIYQGPLCWDVGVVPITFLQLFPLEVPYNATYLGIQTVNGIKCTVWLWDENYDGYGGTIEMWVSVKESTVVQIITGAIPYVNDIIWGFTNTITGAFNPSIYGAPNLNCPLINFLAPRKSATPARQMIQKLLSAF